MAASFASASTQYLICATHPITAYPYSVGLWVYPTTTGAERTFFCLTDSGAATQRNALWQLSTNVWAISAWAGGTPNNASAGTVTANRWVFIVGRFISATNRRISVLQGDGSVVAAQGTTSRAFPTSAESISIGAMVSTSTAQYLDGNIGEFWYTNTDIQPDGLALQEPLLRQLAYGGPFSVPHIGKDLIEYRSFRKSLTTDQDDGVEVYSESFGVQTWTNTNGVTIGHHPPLPYWYENPRQRRSVLMI